MTFDVPPPAGSSPVEPAVAAAPRARREPRPPIPREVRAEMNAAARLADELAEQGRAVRFDLEDGVVALLVDEDGAILRDLALADAIDPLRLATELDSGF
jgi:hypothetical protein